ncbi:hypothetical protein BU23DRAFT_374235, partial [Bimuria novae-zelandiae CBS 107.79]
GLSRLELFLPDDYPMIPPRSAAAPWVRFLTKIYYLNIDRLGRICLDTLQIRTILLSIQALLGAPNPDDLLANDVA